MKGIFIVNLENPKYGNRMLPAENILKKIYGKWVPKMFLSKLWLLWLLWTDKIQPKII